MEEFTGPQVTADDHVRGLADAPVTVIEYGDYECPYCRGAARDVHLLLDRNPDTVRFVFRADRTRRARRNPQRRERHPEVLRQRQVHRRGVPLGGPGGRRPGGRDSPLRACAGLAVAGLVGLLEDDARELDT